MPLDLRKIESRLKDNVGRDVVRIQRMIRQPSVSGERLGIRECAQLVESYMRDSGCQVAEICETKGNPVVFGELAAGARHTLIVYMMYDTQPFEGETWSHPPLEASLVPHEGFPSAVIGRGAINTKGPMVAFFNALLAVKESGETLPLNLKFVAEGEEELGSPHLPEFFRDNLALLRAAEAVYYPGASQDRNGRVKMYLGNKGILYLELVCSGARWGRGPKTHAIHSANKAWVDSPVFRMVKALSTLVSEDGNRVAVQGFYDDTLDPSPEERRLVQELARTFDSNVVKEQNKFDRFIDDLDGADLLERFLYSSTLNIDGIWGGYTGPGTKTVLPHEVRAKVDIRLVPNQVPDRVLEALRSHLDRHAFPDVEINVHDKYEWSQTPVDATIVRAMRVAYERMGHTPEMWVRAGGSLPMYLFTKDPLRLPAITGGLGHGARAHAPDEYMVIEGAGKVSGLVEQEMSYLRILEAYAEVAG